MDYQKLAVELFEFMAKTPKIPMEEPKEFTRGEMGILVYLHFKKDGVTSGDLSENLTVSTGRIATALKRLEKKGLIERRSNPADKRKVHVFITDSGKKSVLKRYQEGIAKMEKILQKLGEQDAKEFIRLVKKIIT